MFKDTDFWLAVPTILLMFLALLMLFSLTVYFVGWIFFSHPVSYECVVLEKSYTPSSNNVGMVVIPNSGSGNVSVGVVNSTTPEKRIIFAEYNNHVNKYTAELEDYARLKVGESAICTDRVSKSNNITYSRSIKYYEN